MIGIVTGSDRFYDYLAGVFSEEGFAFERSLKGDLLVVDLDSAEIPAGAKAVITVSSDIFKASDLFSPFLQAELVALVCERMGKGGEAVTDLTEKESCEMTVDASSVVIFSEKIELLPAEARLLTLLYENRGQVVPLNECEAVCRVRTSRGNSVSVTVASLRKKLDYHFDRRMILSVRGEGYKLIL